MTKTMIKLRPEKGSALLISLMIMVGLSLLGLGFVAISETESAIAVNERNYVQAQAAAETGVKTVIDMFQDAGWADAEKILPSNIPTFKVARTIKNGSSGVDYYRSNAGGLMFDAPFRGSRANRFFGDVETPDVWIKRDGGAGTAYLDKLNAKIFYNGSSTANDQTRISDIRVYAPPWPTAAKVYSGGATSPGAGESVNGGWWDASTTESGRFGIATVRVTGQRLIGGKVVAERTVKAVLAETPFPTVDGAIETSGSLVGTGNFNVYWGKILSEKAMIVNRPAVGMPWPDAKNFIYFEYGFDTTLEWKAGKSYNAGDLIHAPDTCIAADSSLGKFAFRAQGGGTAPASTNCPLWQAGETIGASVNDGVIVWKAEAGRMWDIDSTLSDPTTKFYKTNGWVYQMLGRTIEDPWLHARARNGIQYKLQGSGGTPGGTQVPCNKSVDPTDAHPCDYDNTAYDVQTRYSNMFQYQYTTVPGNYPEQIEAVFPTMDYEFWKSIAQSSSNQPGTSIYYFKFIGGTGKNSNDFQGPGGKTKSIYDWVNSALTSSGKPYNGLGAGFYFFDTANGKNPQFKKGGTLTPDVDINSGTTASPFQMQGYIYLNAANIGTSGVGSMVDDDVYAMPGEPYRDVGYREVEDDKASPYYLKFRMIPASGTLPTANFSVANANNGQWDYQDVNRNGQFDVVVGDITKGGTVQIPRPDGTGNLPTPTYMPVPYTEGCQIPDPLATPPVTGNCSEPHEPYLNLTYPDVSNPKGSVKIEWYQEPAGGAVTTYRKPKLRTGKNTVNTCSDTSTASECTSNGHDDSGALVRFAPILVGALYNEGGYNGTGNATFYGALLMRGDFSGKGTPDVYFDECLAKGCLETQLKMQRVMVTSLETD